MFLSVPTITSLKPQKKDPQRINVFLDGQYQFSLDLHTVTKHQLKPNLQLTNDQINQLLEAGELQHIFNNVIKLISRRPRSEKEFDDWFRKKGVGELVVQQIKPRLAKLGLLNDQKFAEWWIDQRSSFRPRGARLLAQELTQKGIAKSIIDQALQDLPDSTEAIKALATKKLKSLARDPLPKQKQKLYRHLLSKGYVYSHVRSVVEELLKQN
jgi:regulatory protein